MEILSAVKGSTKEKRLASQFITRFFKHFPNLGAQALEAQLDLCEDEDIFVSNYSFTFGLVKLYIFCTFVYLDKKTSN